MSFYLQKSVAPEDDAIRTVLPTIIYGRKKHEGRTAHIMVGTGWWKWGIIAGWIKSINKEGE